MKPVQWLLSVVIGVIAFAITDSFRKAEAVNARINLPETSFTCSKISATPGQGFTILVEAPACKSFKFDVGAAGNAHLTCVQ